MKFLYSLEGKLYSKLNMTDLMLSLLTTVLKDKKKRGTLNIHYIIKLSSLCFI